MKRKIRAGALSLVMAFFTAACVATENAPAVQTAASLPATPVEQKSPSPVQETALPAEGFNFPSSARFLDAALNLAPYVVFSDILHTDPTFDDFIFSEVFIEALARNGRTCLAVEKNENVYGPKKNAVAAGLISPESYSASININPLFLSSREFHRRNANLGRALRAAYKEGVAVHFVDRYEGLDASTRALRLIRSGKKVLGARAALQALKIRTEDSGLAKRILAAGGKDGCIVAYGNDHGANRFNDADLDEHLSAIRIAVVKNRGLWARERWACGPDLPEIVYFLEEKKAVFTGPAPEAFPGSPRLVKAPGASPLAPALKNSG